MVGYRVLNNVWNGVSYNVWNNVWKNVIVINDVPGSDCAGVILRVYQRVWNGVFQRVAISVGLIVRSDIVVNFVDDEYLVHDLVVAYGNSVIGVARYVYGVGDGTFLFLLTVVPSVFWKLISAPEIAMKDGFEPHWSWLSGPLLKICLSNVDESPHILVA